MKSIKEKAKEHSLEPRSNAHCGYNEEDLENSFEAGANYVLEEVESLMKDVSDEYPRFHQGTIIQGRMIKLLEQLKK